MPPPIGPHHTELKRIEQTSTASGQRSNNLAPALAALVEGATGRLVLVNPCVVRTCDKLPTP